MLLLSACVTGGVGMQYRTLNPISNAVRTHFKVVHKGGKTYLLIYSELSEYTLTAAAYNEFDTNDKIWDSGTAQVQDCPFAAGAKYVEVFANPRSKLYGLYVSVQNPSQRYIYSDIMAVNPHQDGPQTIHFYKDGQVLPRAYVAANQAISIGHASDTVRQFAVRRITSALPIAAAPTSQDVKPFSPIRAPMELQIVPRDSVFALAQKGVYFIQTDTASNKGVFLQVVDEDFPKLTQLAELIEAMRYITKNDEYQTLMNAADGKAELDRYWLARSLDKERARSLLRTYYRRAETANYYFTAEQVGWRTDRGIIFMVFGKPENVRKFANKEVWTYSQTPYRPSIEFIFNRTGEIYTLQRSESYRNYWNSEIMQWRNGAMHKD